MPVFGYVDCTSSPDIADEIAERNDARAVGLIIEAAAVRRITYWANGLLRSNSCALRVAITCASFSRCIRVNTFRCRSEFRFLTVSINTALSTLELMHAFHHACIDQVVGLREVLPMDNIAIDELEASDFEVPRFRSNGGSRASCRPTTN